MEGKVKPEVAFGEALREQRLRRGLSQEKLAFEADLERNFISLLELGQRTPTIKTVFKLAAVLGLRASKMLSLTEAKMKGRGKAKPR